MGLTNDLEHQRGTGECILLGTESKRSLENEVVERRENKQTDRRGEQPQKYILVWDSEEAEGKFQDSFTLFEEMTLIRTFHI